MGNDSWRSLPNGPLLNELLELANRFVNIPGDYDYDAWNMADMAAILGQISVLGRSSIWDEWVHRLNVMAGWSYGVYSLLYCAGLALIAWDEAGELYKLNADQLRLTMQLLPEPDWRYIASYLLLPLKEYLDDLSLG